MGLSYEDAKRVFLKTILILAAITVFEVAFALLGKGYLIEGVELPGMLVGGVMIVLSLYKAFLIVFEFMHMKYEAPTLMRSILLPLILLVWGIIAFLWDGEWWSDQRDSAGAQVEFVAPADDADAHSEDVHSGDAHGGDHHDHGHDGDHHDHEHGDDDHHDHDGHDHGDHDGHDHDDHGHDGHDHDDHDH